MIGEQEKALGIAGFIKEAQKYTNEAFEGANINEIYKSALTGDLKLEGLMRGNIKNTRDRSSRDTKKFRVHINNSCNT